MFAKCRIENYNTYHVNAIFYQYCRHIALDMQRLRCENKRNILDVDRDINNMLYVIYVSDVDKVDDVSFKETSTM